MYGRAKSKFFSLTLLTCALACGVRNIQAADTSFFDQHKQTAGGAVIGLIAAAGLYSLGRFVEADLSKHGLTLATGAGVALGGATGVYMALQDTKRESALKATQNELFVTQEDLKKTREDMLRIQSDFSALQSRVNDLN